MSVQHLRKQCGAAAGEADAEGQSARYVWRRHFWCGGGFDLQAAVGGDVVQVGLRAHVRSVLIGGQLIRLQPLRERLLESASRVQLAAQLKPQRPFLRRILAANTSEHFDGLQCIAASPHAARIDYIVLTRGLPIRANFPDSSAPPTKPVSIAELLRVMDTPLRGRPRSRANG